MRFSTQPPNTLSPLTLVGWHLFRSITIASTDVQEIRHTHLVYLGLKGVREVRPRIGHDDIVDDTRLAAADQREVRHEVEIRRLCVVDPSGS